MAPLAVDDLAVIATRTALDHGIDLDSLWWIDRPDRAVVTAGVPGDVMADAIVDLSLIHI